MKECDNSKIHISSNFILSVCLLTMLDTLFLRPPLHCNTSLHFTQLHFATLIDTSLPLIYTSVPSHLAESIYISYRSVSAHITRQYCSPISKLISKIMNPFTALKNLSPFHFTSLHFTSLHPFFFYLSYQPFISLHFAIHIYNSLPFTSLHLCRPLKNYHVYLESVRGY
jgi:hypothetical protein